MHVFANPWAFHLVLNDWKMIWSRFTHGGRLMKAKSSQSGVSTESQTIPMVLNPIMQVLMPLCAPRSHPYQRAAQSCALLSRFGRWVLGMNGAGKG
jgi:hypothetical protein